MSELKNTGIVSSDKITEYGLYTIYGWSFTSVNASITGPTNNGYYTIVSDVTSSGWGSQFCVVDNGKIRIPWGCTYRIGFEVYVPTAHNIQIDINNRTETGSNPGGNDNDEGRTETYFYIPTATWTPIIWGSSNINSINTNKEDLLIYDYVGLITSSDTSPTTWQIRNARVEIGYTNNNKFSVKPLEINSNKVIEY